MRRTNEIVDEANRLADERDELRRNGLTDLTETARRLHAAEARCATLEAALREIVLRACETDYDSRYAEIELALRVVTAIARAALAAATPPADLRERLDAADAELAAGGGRTLAEYLAPPAEESP